MTNYDERGITARLLVVAKLLGLNDTELAKQLGVKKQMIGQMRNNIITAPPKRVIIFLAIHEEVDARWLFFGKGEMIVKPVAEGKHKLTVKSPGTMEFTSEAGTDSGYKEKYEHLKVLLKEKEKYINVIEKSMDRQDQLFERLMEKSKDEP